MIELKPKELALTQFADPDLAREILELIAPIARHGLLESYTAATKVTPYAASMLGRKKRSGQRITNISPPSPPFGFDTGKFRDSLERLYTIDRDTLTLYSDVVYAQSLLDKFEQKGYPVQVEEETIDAMARAIEDKIEQLWQKKADDLPDS
jgi:hypothetical protein